MASITQDMRFRLSLIRYAEKHGVSRAASRCKTNRQYVYRWKNRFDGSIESLRDKSRRSHHRPNQHTPQEIKLISDMRRRNPHAVHPPNPKYVPKPYEQMTYPGGRIQIDVKFVPSACLLNSHVRGKQFFQYTAIDEYSRWRFVKAFGEHSSYSSMQFLEHLVKAFPRPIECVQTDNGQEFTKRFSSGGGSDKPAIFQVRLAELGIWHKLVRPFTPRHNGKAESSHRKDNERFYATHTFYSFEDFSRQLKIYNSRDYNNFPMRPLGWKTPRQVLLDYLQSV